MTISIISSIFVKILIMSKKIIFTPEQIDTIIKLYVEELKGTPAIGELFNVHKAVINRTLKENGIVLDQSGRRNIGGKSEANKRYQAKNKDDIKIYHQEWSKENRDDLRKYHSTWRDNNRVKVRKWARDYEREKEVKTLSIGYLLELVQRFGNCSKNVG